MIIVCPACSGPLRLADEHIAPLVQIECAHCRARTIFDFEAANDPSLSPPGTPTTPGYFSEGDYHAMAGEAEALPVAAAPAAAVPAAETPAPVAPKRVSQPTMIAATFPPPVQPPIQPPVQPSVPAVLELTQTAAPAPELEILPTRTPPHSPPVSVAQPKVDAPEPAPASFSPAELSQEGDAVRDSEPDAADIAPRERSIFVLTGFFLLLLVTVAVAGLAWTQHGSFDPVPAMRTILRG